MAVNVSYEGISLAEGAQVQPSELGLFLPLPAPMPVGSRLVLARSGEAQQGVRVTRVREGAEPGVYIVAEGAVVFPLVEEAAPASQVPQAVEPEVTTPSPPPTLLATAALVEVSSSGLGPEAGDGDADGDEDDTIVTITNGSEKPDANGERATRKGKRGKRGGGKR